MKLLVIMFLLKPPFLLAANPKCTKPNEVFGCARPCDPTCTNPSPAPCDAPCEPRCVCAKGFLRNSQGECIPTAKCNNCNINPLQEYSDCGLDCPGCYNSPDIMCLLAVCYRGCFCILDHLKNSWNQCIPVDKCKSCGKYEEFREGVSGCPPSCDDPNPPFCPTFIRQDECSCVEGYVRAPNKKCVRLEDCPKKPYYS